MASVAADVRRRTRSAWVNLRLLTSAATVRHGFIGEYEISRLELREVLDCGGVPPLCHCEPIGAKSARALAQSKTLARIPPLLSAVRPISLRQREPAEEEAGSGTWFLCIR
jgi:hypothetical protein